jgi:dolichol-phosphate mannosyltransferase
MRENVRYVRGLVAWVGFRQIDVEYDRDIRLGGKTKYSFLKLLQLSLNGIFSFSTFPLKLASIVGFFCAFGAFLYVLYALYAKLILNDTPPGWTSIAIAVFFLGGVQLICIGILGEYIGMIHEESKRRPLYLIREIY